jgi:hypothetical protein
MNGERVVDRKALHRRQLPANGGPARLSKVVQLRKERREVELPPWGDSADGFGCAERLAQLRHRARAQPRSGESTDGAPSA